MKLLVRNLAKATTEEKLLSLFTQYGAVQSCNIVMDNATGSSKGFGFVVLPKAGEAKAAIKHLNGYKLAGNKIRVKKAEDKKVEPESEVKEIKAPTHHEKKASADIKNNSNNALHLYGNIKKDED